MPRNYTGRQIEVLRKGAAQQVLVWVDHPARRTAMWSGFKDRYVDNARFPRAFIEREEIASPSIRFEAAAGSLAVDPVTENAELEVQEVSISLSLINEEPGLVDAIAASDARDELRGRPAWVWQAIMDERGRIIDHLITWAVIKLDRGSFARNAQGLSYAVFGTMGLFSLDSTTNIAWDQPYAREGDTGFSEMNKLRNFNADKRWAPGSRP